MTVRNGETYIADAIASINCQTLDNWELVIVDDGSTDSTVNLLEAEAQSDSRLKLILTSGVGRARALNMALDASSSDYVLNLDADDLAHPRRLEYQLAAIREHDDYDLISSSNIRFWGNSTPVWEDVEHSTTKLQKVRDSLLSGNPICHSGIIAKRSSLLKVAGYNEKKKSQVDFDLWVRLVVSGANLGVTSMPLVGKRIHDNQQFAGQKPVIYALKSVAAHAWAIKTLNGGAISWLRLAPRFVWAFIPLKMRFHVRKMLKK